MNVLGIRIDNLSHEEVLEKVKGFLTEEWFHQIATINPEFILRAQDDEEFKNILNNCNLNVADGFGISCAFFYHGEILKSRLAGIDLMEEILRFSEKNNLKIFLATSNRGLSAWEETQKAILKKYPNLIISGANINPPCHSELAEESTQIRSFGSAQDDKCKIKEFDIAFANFGAPYQEKWIQRNLSKLKVKVAIGVGGALDYLAGDKKRAPFWIRKMGFEWFFRLLSEPWRFKRQLRLPYFIFLVLKEKMSHMV